MRELSLKELNGINLEPYILHPRMLELKIIMTHHLLMIEYDLNVATKLFRNLCDIFNIDWKRISGIINQFANIKRMSKTNIERYRQEVIFMGMLYNQSRYYVAEKYLNISLSTLYRKRYNLNPKDYVCEEWLDLLDNSVVVCGVPQYKREAIRFIEALEGFLEAMGNVFIPKITL